MGAEILADDGAVVYLDGVEVTRFNCCSTPEDDYLSFSSSGGEEGGFTTISFVDDLPAGDHLLAVSVHQANTGSSDLGLGLRLLSDVELPPVVDTFVQEGSPNSTNGYNDEWEWDGSTGDPPGETHGLLWFDISSEELAGFGDGTATLQLTVTDSGDSANVHRMTEDWLSAAPGGNVSWDSIPGGPGIVPGQNAEDTMSFGTGGLTSGNVYTFDVSDDVLAWASGVPNYGWGFVPTGGGGLEVASFEESTVADRPQLTLEPGAPIGPALQAGDADQDLDFDQLDLVKVQIASKYLSGQPATWGEGDWNAALQEASPGNPRQLVNGFVRPAGYHRGVGCRDTYLTGPYAAINQGGDPERWPNVDHLQSVDRRVECRRSERSGTDFGQHRFRRGHFYRGSRAEPGR